MKPKVINIKDAPALWWRDYNFVYIGRAKIGYQRTGYFGNPFKLGEVCTRCGDEHLTPGSTLKCYEAWLRDTISAPVGMEGSRLFASEVKALWGKTLVCHCKPGPCHGDILAQVCAELNLMEEMPEDAGATYTGIEDYDPFADMN